MPRPRKPRTKRTELRRPRTATTLELRKAGVRLVDEHSFWLMCDQCKTTWSPSIPGEGKRLFHGYWRCPNGCNADARR